MRNHIPMTFDQDGMTNHVMSQEQPGTAGPQPTLHEVFLEHGTTEWVALHSPVLVECVGQSSAATAIAGGGSGGDPGAYAYATLALVVGNTYAVNVPDGNEAGDCYFKLSSLVFGVLAGGGPSDNTIHVPNGYAGGKGAPGGLNAGGGGGGAGGPLGPGADGQSPVLAEGGVGGAGGGPGATGGTDQGGNGGTGTAWGGGTKGPGGGGGGAPADLVGGKAGSGGPYGGAPGGGTLVVAAGDPTPAVIRISWYA